jgi:hypothetical protein
MESYIPLTPLLTALGVMLALSLVVERTLSVFAWIINRIVMIKCAAEVTSIPSFQVQLEADKRALEDDSALRASPVPGSDGVSEIDPHPLYASPPSRFDVKHYEIQDSNAVLKTFWMQILGVLIGICGCAYAKFSVWMLVQSPVIKEAAPQAWEYLLTGLIIGGGTKPINMLMNFLINRKLIIKRKEFSQSTVAPEPPRVVITESETKSILTPSTQVVVPSTSIAQIVGIQYDGGDRPDRLQNTHMRSGRVPLDMIIFHHTAMHADAPFEEITKEFDRKGWLTGYHAVVFKDGSMRALCRWDRIGNHATGFNERSLGIAFHGNFETDPLVPFSNPDGRFGSPYPTDIQIDAGARLVVLWHFLYGVKVNFKTAIIPHSKVAQKACPGRNFPSTLFEARVNHYAQLWKGNREFQQAACMFKFIPMVMA